MTLLADCSMSPHTPNRRNKPLISLTPSRAASNYTSINGTISTPRSSVANGSTLHASSKFTFDNTLDEDLGEDDKDNLVWGEQQRDDPVGDCITRMLNEGNVPYFGFRDVHVEQNSVEERFEWSPLLSLRNYRATKTKLKSLIQMKSPSNSPRQGSKMSGIRQHVDTNRESMWFMIETFLAIYITVYSLNDLFIRSTLDFILFLFFGVISTIVDVGEMKLFLFHKCPQIIQEMTLKCINTTKELFTTIESQILWGQRFQGRTLLWSDKQRILKFRRKHLRVMQVRHDRRINRRQRRKSRKERKRRERKGLSFDSCDFARMEAEMAIKEALNDAAEELRRKPPTYFPSRVHLRKDTAAKSVRSSSTKKHFNSLEYCHSMIFRSQIKDDMKPVSITTNRQYSGMNTLSPPEAIEVTDDFPDIQVDADAEDVDCSDTVSSSASNYTLHDNYDLDSVSDDSNSDESENDNGDNDLCTDDDLSQISYASEESVGKMNWIKVGAKIGTKILKSKEVHRVISNPSSKLIPEEAKRLIGGINTDQADDRSGSQHKSSTFDSQYSKVKELKMVSSVESQSASTGTAIPKPPVHGMWTSAGSAAQYATSPYGAVTLPNSDSTPKHRGRKIFVSSAQECVELMRESSDGKVDVTDDNIDRPVPVLSPYNLRLVNSMPTNGTITPTRATPKSSNQASATCTPPRNQVSTNRSDSTTRLAPIEKGSKIVVPMFAPNASSGSTTSGFLQMGTVISSSRIFVSSEKVPKKHLHKWNLLGGHREEETNCLAIKLILDRAILRGSQFATMHIRILDEWNWIPRFSKYPIGSCVATTFGIGVLVGWRVEDDMHIIRSLWNRSGPGSGLAYLRRECLHGVVEAAVGFDVETRLGSGRVAAYVKGGKNNTEGKYFVHLKSKGRYQDRVVEFKRNQILSCSVAKFIPVTEHIRAAALYQLEILHYKARVRERMLSSDPLSNERQRGTWRKFSEYVDLFAACLSKAIAEDPEFDQEVDKFINHIISVLDDHKDADEVSVTRGSLSKGESTVDADQISVATEQSQQNTDWNIQDVFASFFAVEHKKPVQPETDHQLVLTQVEKFRGAHHSVSIILRVLLRTVAIAKATVPDRPKLHIALAMIHESLLFVRQVNRVQNKNISIPLIEAWFKTVNEISRTFAPLKERFEMLGKKMAKKMKKHSDIAKKRVLSFVDIVLTDTQLIFSLERGEWKESLCRVEYALVKAKITDEATCEQLRKGVILLYKNLAPRKKDKMSKAAARRTEAKALRFAKLIKILAAPGRSVLRLLTSDDILELFDRVLLRVFDHNQECSMMINIFAFSNFRSMRDMRTLNNMAIVGRLWATILDACDEELSFVMSEIPESQKYFLDPFVKLFSLGVAKFHCIQSGRSNADWLDFLMEEDAVKIIQDLDMKLIDCLDSFCKDVKQLFEVMPYIKTIDNDILDLMDELDFDLMFKELTGSIGDPNKFTEYITERSAILVERFLDYLPRMSIPIEKRELQDGWVLTCRGSDGGDLRLSDINVKRENLLCEVLGGDNVFRPLGKDDYIGSPKKNIFPDPSFDSLVSDEDDEEGCVLDEIREIILSAKQHGCWVPGLGGLREPFFYIGVPTQLQDLPLSEPLKTGIDLWQSSAISSFEFMQIAIREVSNQIELHKGEERSIGGLSTQNSPRPNSRRKFNPRVDSVLLLDIKNLTLHLDEFIFRVEKGENKTIFDPVFEGAGSLTVKNVSISLRIEVKKDRVKNENGFWMQRPILQLASFDVRLEKLTILFKETGADWILNTVLKGFRDQINYVVQDNVKKQIMQQVHTALDHVNEMFTKNPELLMTMLGITLDELESVYV